MIPERRLSGDGDALTIRIPMRFERRGYAKRIIGPDGERVVVEPAPAGLEDPLIRALARAWRWKRMLESGGYGSVGELAAAEKVNFSYLCRFLRLTLLEPAVIDRILEGREGAETSVEALLTHPVTLGGQAGVDRFGLLPAADRHFVLES